MAAQTAVLTQHATLSGTTVDSVALSGGPTEVTVFNHAAAGGTNLYVTVAFGSTVAAVTDPVAAADETYVVVPGGFVTFREPNKAKYASVVVKVLGNGNAYTVQGHVL